MRGSGTLRTLLAVAGLCAAPALASPSPPTLYFEANQGQAPAALRFVGRVRGTPLGVADDGLVLGVGAARVRLVWENARGAPEAAAPLAGRSHYLRGSDPSQWQRDVPHFARVRYPAAWPGIDIELHEGGDALEFDFVVAPGADPAAIAFRFEGAERVDLAGDGSLEIRAGGGLLVQRLPRVFQEGGGERREIESRYVRRDARRIGVALGAYDRARPLVVDPVLSYSTALGGPGRDKGFDVAVDAQGNAYVAGEIGSATGFATPGGLQPGLAGGTDAFVAKLSPTGALLYATYLGGSGDDAAWSVAVGSDGAVYLSGVTASNDFPTHLPIQPTLHGSTDAFVAKLAPGGASLAYATYLGGSGDDNAEAIALAPGDKAVLKGVTSSTDFPTRNALLPAFGGVRDAFVTQLASDGQSLEWSTYLGGSGAEDPDGTGVGVAVDGQGNVVVCGTTESEDFPVQAAMQPVFGGGMRDGYFAKLTSSGALVFSSYLGRSGGDTLRAVAVDEKGFLYLGGASRSFDFPLVHPVQRTKSVHYDAVIVKVDPTGQRLVFSTYLGGNAPDAVRSIAVDAHHNVYVHGQTQSTDFPQLTPLPGQKPGLLDAFVAKLAPSGSQRIYSSVVGGSLDESLTLDNIGIAVDATGHVVIAGATASAIDFPFVAAIDTVIEGFDAFAMRISATPEIDLLLAGSAATPTYVVQLRNGSPTTADGQVKLYLQAAPDAAPVALDFGTSPLQSVPSGGFRQINTPRPLPGPFVPGEIVTARWLDRATGRLMAEAVCEDVPCP